MVSQNRLAFMIIAVAVGGGLFALIILGLSPSQATQAEGGPPQLTSSKTTATNTPNIILIIADALRADHVSSNGYDRPTTPNLDTYIAEQGVSFSNATTLAAWTFPSNAATFTGRAPSSIGVNWSNPSSAIPAEEMMLAEYLHEAGYSTVGFVANWFVNAQFGFDQGFDLYERLPRSDDDIEARANKVSARAIELLDSQWLSGQDRGQPLFLLLYYYDPHTWYTPPPPYDTMYDSTYTDPLTGEYYAHGDPVVSGVYTPTERDVEHIQALYDGEITYWDHHLGEILAYLDSHGLLDDSIVIVTSDHGQMFGEHDKWVHRNSLYEEVLRVPLLIRYTGVVSAGLVVTTPVQTMDITPTILDWLDLPIPGNLDGRSLSTLAQGIIPTQTYPIFSEQGQDKLIDPDWYVPEHDLLSIRRGNWKYTHHINHPEANELYQLQTASPYETVNLRYNKPEIADNLFRELVDRFHIPTQFIYLPLLSKRYRVR